MKLIPAVEEAQAEGIMHAVVLEDNEIEKIYEIEDEVIDFARHNQAVIIYEGYLMVNVFLIGKQKLFAAPCLAMSIDYLT